MTATTLYMQYVDVMNAQINEILSHFYGHNVKKTYDSEAMAEQFKQMLEASIGYVRVVVPKEEWEENRYEECIKIPKERC